jgi:hypothetical protein
MKSLSKLKELERISRFQKFSKPEIKCVSKLHVRCFSSDLHSHDHGLINQDDIELDEDKQYLKTNAEVYLILIFNFGVFALFFVLVLYVF